MVAKARSELSGRSAHLAVVAPPAEKRLGGRRQHVTIPATILCPDGAAHACIIRDMSATGAKLGVSRRHDLPPGFALAIPGRDLPYPVVRLWRRGDFAGVALAAQKHDAG